MFTAGWPDVHIAALKERFDRGMSFAQISADMNATFGTAYSRNACIGKAKRLGLKQSSKPAPPPRPKRERRQPQIRAERRGPPLASVEYEAIECEPINHIGVSIYELTTETCRWPIGTPGHEDFCFCGNAPISGLPYCPGHSRLAYRVP